MWKVYEDLQMKQVSAHGIQVSQGSMGIDAWNTFILRVEHPYILRVGEIPYEGAHLPCRENCMLPIATENQSACFSFSLHGLGKNTATQQQKIILIDVYGDV